jgi:hypothetical protein
MKTWIALSALLLCSGFSMTAAAGCDNPPLVNIPADEDLSKRQMERVTEETQQYFTAMQEFVACLQAELQSAGGDDAPTLYRNVLVQRNNAAVAEAQAVQKWFVARFGSDTGIGPPAKE